MKGAKKSGWGWVQGQGLVFSALGMVLLLSGPAALQGGAEGQGGRFEFGLIGDQQYDAESEAKFSHLMEDLNQADLAFVVHTGDFKGGQLCSDGLFSRRKNEFQASRHPWIYTPGDNEWTDCHRLYMGRYDPRERLARLREIFFSGDRSLGQRALALERQSGDSKYAKFSENVRWTYSNVLFVTLHIVGSNNNLGRSSEMDAEYQERNAANLAWLRQAFDLARRDRMRGIMLIMQANPFFEDTWSSSRRESLRIAPPDRQRSGYSDFLSALERETVTSGMPVVLVHGEAHYFRIDKPMFSSTSKRMVENFTRVETFGVPDVHWVRALVDPKDPNLFTFKPEIVKKNLVDHRSP